MKKTLAIVALVLVLASALFVFTGCGAATKTGKCDLCGKTNVSVKKLTVAGEDGWFCNDCYEVAKGLGSLFGR